MSRRFVPGTGYHGESIRQILEDHAEDFVPPISERRLARFLSYLTDPEGSLLAFDDGDLAGFIAWKPFDEKDIKPDRYQNIKILFILPAYRRMGLAKAIRERALERMADQGFRGVVTTCWARNEGMIRLNQSMGFSLIGRYPAPWRGPGEESLIHEKRFTPAGSKDS